MSSTKHVVIASSSSFIIAIIIVWVFVSTNESQFEDYISLEIEFYEDKVPPKERNIFILGSSMVGRINATFVNQVFLENNVDYKVYNLGKSRDLPTERLKVIDYMIEAKPEIVMYGLGFRDFGHQSILRSNMETSVRSLNCDQLSAKNPLPSPKDLLPLDIILENYYEELSPLTDPKQTTINTIRDVFSLTDPKKLNNNPYQPFYAAHPGNSEAISEHELQQRLENTCVYALEEVGHVQKITLDKILNKLNQNDITTVLFIVPQDKFYLNMLTNDEKINFELTLKELSDKHSIPLYSLLDNYHEMEIWSGMNHIAMNQSASIYSRDIAMMGLEVLP
jgi:hypothetical protein